MKVLEILHKRHKVVAERYGPHVAHATHVGEGVYLGSAMWLDHHLMVYVYGGLFVIWCCHTIIVGFEE